MLLCVASLLDLRLSFAQQSSSSEVTDLRVGIISYDNPEEKIQGYQKLFSDLKDGLFNLQISDTPSFAVGTYADVLDWISRGLVDIAVLSPSAFAETTNSTPNALDCIYIATEGIEGADDESWANDELKQRKLGDHCRFAYNSICIVRADSALQTFDDLKTAASEGRVQFVFGDPLSASSAILPMHILQSYNIDFRDHLEYTFGHRDSVDHLRNAPKLKTPEGELEHVAFVFDGEVESADRANFHHIEIPLKSGKSMTDILLPQEVWVARKDYDSAKIVRIQKLLRDHKLTTPAGKTLVDHFGDQKARFASTYMELKQWANDVRKYVTQEDSGGDFSGMTFPIRFKDVISLVRHYDCIHQRDGKKSRLAMVLAGGGAKCAYEAGVVTQLERQLHNALEPSTVQDPDGKPIDIDLIVGTSGGALNAVPIAAGVSQRGAGEAERDPPMNRTWKRLNALDILRPPPHVQLLLGIAYAFCYFIAIRLIVLGLQMLSSKSPLGTWQRVLVLLLIIAPSVFLALSFFFPVLLFYVGWKWLFYVIVCLVVIRLVLGRKKRSSMNPRGTSQWVVVLLLIIVPSVFLVLSLLFPVLLFYVGSKWLFYVIVGLSFGVFCGSIFSIVWGLLVVSFNKRAIPAVDLATSSQHKAISVITLPRWFLRMLSWADPRRPVPASEFISLITALVVIAALFVGHHSGGVFRGDRLSHAVTKSYAELFGPSAELHRNELAKHPRIISKNIYATLKRGQRDLVITASSLNENSRGTKYFYVQAEAGSRRNPWKPPSYGTQGIEIGHTDGEKPDKGGVYKGHCDPKNLVDIAIGSGTIFPFFSAHKVKYLEHTNYPMERMDLIDGGFAHNSPIQAAVRWGATHIILLQVSPASVRGYVDASFWGNVNTAFDYLYDQAQFADVDAQEEAAVFMLQPQLRNDGPSVGLLDFGPRFADSQLNSGLHDASRWRFVRQPAAPHFWAIQPQK